MDIGFGNIAIATVIVGFLNLVMVVLTKTETILKIVERIKGVIRLDYKSRAKRSDDEKRILQKHAQVARERIRHTFITMEKWKCKWTWNWSENFEPINIRGYCTGNDGTDYNYECDQPVYGYISYPEEKDKKFLAYVVISCTNDSQDVHRWFRADFEVFASDVGDRSAEDVLNEIVSRAILSERELRITKEIKKLRLQFWR